MNQTYTVKPGDTLYGISNQFGVSVTELARINNVKAETLQIGQVLKIPSEFGTNPNNMFMYTVKPGDTLYGIARVYGTTVDAIMDLNNLTSVSLSVGQVLRIPETFISESDMNLPNYVNYTVKKGDTLYSISKNFGVPVETLIADNALSSNTLRIGQNLKIRTVVTEIEECFGESYIPQSSTSAISYTVQKGDSLYQIAKKYNTTVDEIKKLNQLTSNTLAIGQVLKIPSSSSSGGTTYVVKKGDSLYQIAKKYNTTVDEIKRKNHLTSNTLSIGQTLIL